MQTLEKLLGNDLSKELKEATHALAHEAAKNEPPSPLNTLKQREALLEKQTHDAFEKLSQDYVEAGKILVSTLEVLARTHPDIHFEKISNELKQVGSRVNKDTFSAMAKAATQEQGSPQDVLKISHETLLALYKAAAHLLEQKHFADATKAFSLLCGIAPNDYDHWIGYGHSSYHHKQFDASILAYYVATSLQPNTPWPLIWAANACEGKGEPEAAVDLLTRAKELAQESHDKELQALAKELQARIVKISSKMKSK